jgi:hypothetical protein
VRIPQVRLATLGVALALLVGAAPAVVLSASQEALAEPGQWSSGQLANAPLSDISCAGSGFCAAIGLYGRAVAVLADGAWTASNLPLPATGTSTISDLDVTSVSCGASGTCVAVGSFINSKDDVEPLIETLSSGTWVAIAGPLPSDTAAIHDVLVMQVSCSSPSSCTAVGHCPSPSGPRGTVALFTDTLSGGDWSAATLPMPSGVNSEALNAFSCSEVLCQAIIGYQTTTQGGQLANADFADTLQGGTWTESSLLLPQGTSPYVTLEAEACTNDGYCTAVGGGGGGGGSLVEQYASGAWTLLPAPTPPPYENSVPGFTGVWCQDGNDCVVVAPSAIETLTGGAWTSYAPTLDQPQEFTSIGCAGSLDSCVAVGGEGASETQPNAVGIFASLQGGTWTLTTDSFPTGGFDNSGPYTQSLDVSCDTSSSCFAVTWGVDPSVKEGFVFQDGSTPAVSSTATQVEPHPPTTWSGNCSKTADNFNIYDQSGDGPVAWSMIPGSCKGKVDGGTSTAYWVEADATLEGDGYALGSHDYERLLKSSGTTTLVISPGSGAPCYQDYSMAAFDCDIIPLSYKASGGTISFTARRSGTASAHFPGNHFNNRQGRRFWFLVSGWNIERVVRRLFLPR